MYVPTAVCAHMLSIMRFIRFSLQSQDKMFYFIIVLYLFVFMCVCVLSFVMMMKMCVVGVEDLCRVKSQASIVQTISLLQYYIPTSLLLAEWI